MSSMFSYDPDLVSKAQSGEFKTNDPNIVGRAVAAPELLTRRYGSGGSWLDSFSARADYAAYEGGAGSTLFGAIRTPARYFADLAHGFDEDLGNRPDPNWNKTQAQNLFKTWATDTQRAAISVAGGRELEEDIINNSVSAEHMKQRLKYIEIVESARMSIDLADQNSSMFGYGVNKTFSALTNYVFSDPVTIVSIAATGGLSSVLNGTRAATAGVMAAGSAGAAVDAAGIAVNATKYSRLASFIASRPNTFRSAMYLWDGMDGAQSGYSYWYQQNKDNAAVYGQTRELDDNWIDNTAFGLGLGLGFSMASDIIPRMFKTDASRNIVRPDSISAVENMAARADQHLGTEADVASMSLWHKARKDLDNALDLTEGPESKIRAALLDNDNRKYLGWDDTASMQELNDFIRNNRPSQDELADFVYSKLRARVQNHAATMSWSDELKLYIDSGGSGQNFFKKKAMDFLRSHMGSEFSKYRFIVDELYEATGSMEQVAEWMARGDKNRVVRAVNALNQSKLQSKLQSDAIDKAITQISERAKTAARSENTEKMKMFSDQLREGRWSGAVKILNEMFTEATDIAGKRIAQIDAAVNEMDRLYSSLNYNGRKKLRVYNQLRERIVDFRRMSAERGMTLKDAKAEVDRMLSPDASVDEILNYASRARDSKPKFESFYSRNVDDIDEVFESIKADIQKFLDLEDTIDDSLRQVRNESNSVRRLAGREALSKTVTFIGSFPRSHVEFTSAGFNAVMEGAARQTMIGNRWKVDFIDLMLGEGAASNAMKSGAMPLRPAKTATEPIKRFTAAEQDEILRKELALVEPEIEKARLAAKDVDAEASIAMDLETATKLKTAADKANLMATRTQNKNMATKFRELADKRNRMAKRFEKLAERKKAELEGRLLRLNEDVPSTAAVTRESVEAARRNAAMQTSASLKNQVDGLSAEDYLSASGRKLRNKARNAAAEVNGVTEYGRSTRVRNALTEEMQAATKRVDDLKSKGALDGDPVLKAAENEVKYLQKQLDKVNSTISTIEGRPAAMKRASNLMGSAPKIDDVVELSRMRAAARAALDSGNEAEVDRIIREMYDKFGDSTALPQWKEYEDIVQKLDSSTNPTKDVILGVKMDGKDIVVTIQRNENIPDEIIAARIKSAAEVTDFEKEAAASAFGSARGARGKTKFAREVKKFADEEWEEARKAFVPTVEELRIKPAIPAEVKPVVSTSAVKTAKTAVTEMSEKVAAINAVLDKVTPGERLLIINAAAVAASRIPAISGLGRAVLRLSAAGTQFGNIQGVSRHLDAIVTAFNMLDNPEVAVKSLGSNRKLHQTYQFFRDDARRIINEVSSILQRVQRELTVESNFNIRRALDTGSMDGLSSAERELAEYMQRHLRRVGAMYAESTGKAVEPNWRPRVGNSRGLISRAREATDDFTEVYMDVYTSGKRAIPDDLAAEFGIPRGTTWTTLSDESKNSFMSALQRRAREDAAETVARQSNNLTLDGAEGRIASTHARSEYTRVLENEVANDPRIAKWYLSTPLDEFAYYMEHSYPRIGFNAQLSKMVGSPTTFDDFIAALETRFASISDSEIRREAATAIQRMKYLWDYQTGRVQYRHDSLLDPLQRSSTAVIRGSAGSFWGLASLATEVPRSVAAARMYGGTILGGLGDLLSAIKNSGDLSLLNDIAHATDQYRTMAHSAYGSTIGTSTWQRFKAPWERFAGVAKGAEAVTTGNQAMGRLAGTVTAFFEALGESAMRASGLQLFSGWARVVADRQAKRFIFRNISNMEKAADALERIGTVSERTPASIAAFKNAVQDAGLNVDTALQLNHAGLLNKSVIKELKEALEGVTDPVLNLSQMRTRLSDEAYGAVSTFLTAAHNYHVPTGSLAQSAPAASAIEKMYYALTNYARAFTINVGYRNMATGSMASVLSTVAAVMVGENLYQSTRDVALGRRTVDDIENSYRTNFIGEFTKNAARTPWMGAHNAQFMTVADELIGMNGAFAGRSGGSIGPILSAYRKTSKMVFENAETGERDYEFLQTYTPFVNAWYTRLMTGQALEN